MTIRGSEERGVCSAALRELFGIIKDQIEERGVINVTNREESKLVKLENWKIAKLTR